MQSKKYQVRGQIRPVFEWSLSHDGQVYTEVAGSSTSLRTCMLVASSIKLSLISRELGAYGYSSKLPQCTLRFMRKVEIASYAAAGRGVVSLDEL